MRREKPMVIRVGCQEKRSLPGTAVYTIKAVRPRVTMWNTILPLNTCDGIEGLCQFMFLEIGLATLLIPVPRGPCNSTDATTLVRPITCQSQLSA